MKNLFILLFLFISATAFCQLGGMSISPNGSPPDQSAILDLNTPNKGFLLPRISQAQRNAISNPALGLQIYDTTNNCIEIYGFGNWQTISCLCSGPPSTPSTITGNNNPCSNASSVTYTVGLVLSASSYTWTVPADATIIAGQGTNSITVNFGATPGNVSVTAGNSCGSSSASVLPVTINTIPSAPDAITGADTVCANSTGNVYAINSVSGATSYTWSLPSGTVTAGQGTTSIIVSFGATQGNMSVIASNVCGNSNATALPLIFPTNHGSQTYNYTGNQQTFAVPQCVTSLNVTAYGAQGGSVNGNTGGNGGTATGTLTTTPGTMLYIYVGNQPINNVGGYNGGGTCANTNGMGGGGATDVRVGGTDVGSRVIVAGGGGGVPSAWTCTGGSGGGLNGGNGTSSNGTNYIGYGGSQGDGGAAESACTNGTGTPGTLGQGGNGSTCDYGGGGGGGYYGGGGGDAGGAGGGSGYIGGVSGGTMQNGVQLGNGQLIIVW